MILITLLKYLLHIIHVLNTLLFPQLFYVMLEHLRNLRKNSKVKQKYVTFFLPTHEHPELFSRKWFSRSKFICADFALKSEKDCGKYFLKIGRLSAIKGNDGCHRWSCIHLLCGCLGNEHMGYVHIQHFLALPKFSKILWNLRLTGLFSQVISILGIMLPFLNVCLFGMFNLCLLIKSGDFFHDAFLGISLNKEAWLGHVCLGQEWPCNTQSLWVWWFYHIGITHDNKRYQSDRKKKEKISEDYTSYSQPLFLYRDVLGLKKRQTHLVRVRTLYFIACYN